jgi:hypothetical protein
MPARAVSIPDRNDFNRDGAVNAADLALVRANFGAVLGPADVGSSVAAAAPSIDALPRRAAPARRPDLRELLY